VDDPLVVPLHYDFASAICFAAHRALPRLAPDLERLGIRLEWTPLDLSGLIGWPRGATLAAARRRNALRVARELGVRLRIPERWIDSRHALAVALALPDEARRASWRERVFCAVFEQGREVERIDQLVPLARDLGFELGSLGIEAALDALREATEAARRLEITGVPTFQLGRWPIGGIQNDETMRALLTRWASRQRRPA